jgi:two-component system cell cycle response regulator
MKVLIADDSKTTIALLIASLEKMGHQVIAANSGEEAIELFQQNHPDLIILDVNMAGMDGFECAKQLRIICGEDWIPIIFLSSSIDDHYIAKGIDAGGDDYLTKPFSHIKLAAKIKAMQRIATMRKKLLNLTEQLNILSVTDSLTGLYNRLQFERIIKEKIAESDRHNHMIALLFIDLDSFKTVNDTLGHHIGDLLLIDATKRLRNCLRTHDFIARMGGDEFAIILNKIENKKTAATVAEKIVHALSQEFTIHGHQIHIGVSIGISLYPSPIRSYETLVSNADYAMYKVKEAGKNNFKFFTENE